jgi:hypothetical protein
MMRVCSGKGGRPMEAQGGFTESEVQAIQELAARVTNEVAPEENAYFEEVFRQYLKEREEGFAAGLTADPTESLGFDTSGVQSLLTPTVITAVVVGISKFVEILAGAIKERKSAKKKEVGIEDIDLQAIGQELYGILRSRRVGSERAKSIVHHFVAQLSLDPSLVLKLVE